MVCVLSKTMLLLAQLVLGTRQFRFTLIIVLYRTRESLIPTILASRRRGEDWHVQSRAKLLHSHCFVSYLPFLIIY